MTSYPVYLSAMDEQRAVVVGTGPTAERKMEGLLEVEAHVTLITPTLSSDLCGWVSEGRIDWRDRTYQDGDLEGAVLAIVTEAAPETKRHIREEAEERNVLLNITGDPGRSTFSNGACIRRGPLVVSISTSGAAPALAVRLRQYVADEFGTEYKELVDIMNALRAPMQEHVTEFPARRERWYTLVDSDVLDLLAKGHRERALTRVESIVGGEVMEEVDGCL